MMTTSNADLEFPPLDVECTDSDCENNLHCFLRDRRRAQQHPDGHCQQCGAQLVNWDQIHKRDIRDANHTVEMLQLELIRHHYWHKPIDQRAENHARRKGKSGIRTAAKKMITKKIAPAEPDYDGRQTPREGNTIFYAQHATASCCRKCVEEWHGIPMGRQLTDEEIEYLSELVCRYVEKRLPTLTDNGEKVPPIRKKVKSEG